ncbi:MAG: hypothetical protein WCF67_17610 [Chitinophagaceae bacterium]
MFELFRKRKHNYHSHPVNRHLQKIKLYVNKLQMVLAARLSRYEQRMTEVQKKVSLFCFLLLMGGLSTYWLYQGIFSKPTASPAFLKQRTIVRPQDISLPDSLNIEVLEALKRKQEKERLKNDSTKN